MFELAWLFHRALATDNWSEKCRESERGGKAMMKRETGQRRARAGACRLFSRACNSLLMEKKLQFLFCGNSFVSHQFLKRALLPLEPPARALCWLAGSAL